jgi:uncharacterized protein (TIGR02145 family)
MKTHYNFLFTQKTNNMKTLNNSTVQQLNSSTTKKHLFVLLFVLTAFLVNAAPPLSVTAEGDGTFTYQWYRTADSININGTKIDGATASTYQPKNDGGEYYYYCVVTSECKAVASEVSGKHKILTMSGCTATTNFLGGTLGTVTYGNDTDTNINSGTTTITGNGITQIWSKHVFAFGCNKTAYAGGSGSANNTDCRKSHATDRNYAGYGDMFSWCAVIKYRDELCPSPWRVPTRQDFENLDKALGGTGANGQAYGTLGPKYVAASGAQGWAGAWGGHCNAGGAVGAQGSALGYWTVSEQSASEAFGLYVSSTSYVEPQSLSINKNYGRAVRCIKGI